MKLTEWNLHPDFKVMSIEIPNKLRMQQVHVSKVKDIKTSRELNP